MYANLTPERYRLKEAYVGKDDVSRFDMMRDSRTKEIILELKRNKSVHVATGLYG